MTSRVGSARLKGMTILGVLLLSALVFLSWSQPWGTLSVLGSSDAPVVLEVPGSTAAPALAALGLAGLALAAALAIAGPVIRIVLGLVQVLLGASIVLSGVGPLIDPVAAGAPIVTKATGVAGVDSIRAITSAASVTPWAAVAIVLGLLIGITGVLVAVTTGRWPESGRRYQPVRFATEDGAPLSADDLVGLAEGGAADGDGGDTPAEGMSPDEAASKRKAASVDNWDSLSQGQDPTA